MSLTTDLLQDLERDANGAPPSMLERCIRTVRSGIAQSHPDVAAHAQALLLKLEHLVRVQRAA